MVEKTNKKKTGGQQPENGGSGGGSGGKNNANTVVLKADLHCEGCVHKVLKCIRSFDGVDDANIGDGQRITVVGKVDPVKLREKVEEKTHKKIELVSPPQNKKDDNKNEGGSKDSSTKCKENSGGATADNAKQDKCKEDDKNSKNKNSDEKKSKQKEIPVSTAVLKVHLHCEGCIQKICKLVTKTKGYQDVKVDRQKGMVTVTGAIDMKGLAQVLKKHLKREVEVTPPPPQKKEVEKKENTGGGGGEKGKGGGGDKGKSGNNKAESGGGGGDKVKSGSSKGESGDKVKSGGGDGGGNGGEMGAGGEKVEGNKIQFQVGYPYPYTYEPGVIDQFHYNMYAFGPYHGPQMFSDENPNACTIM